MNCFGVVCRVVFGLFLDHFQVVFQIILGFVRVAAGSLRGSFSGHFRATVRVALRNFCFLSGITWGEVCLIIIYLVRDLDLRPQKHFSPKPFIVRCTQPWALNPGKAAANHPSGLICLLGLRVNVQGTLSGPSNRGAAAPLSPMESSRIPPG